MLGGFDFGSLLQALSDTAGKAAAQTDAGSAEFVEPVAKESPPAQQQPLPFGMGAIDQFMGPPPLKKDDGDLLGTLLKVFAGGGA